MADYYAVHGGGAVVSSTINRYMYITINPNFDSKIRISYSQRDWAGVVKHIHCRTPQRNFHIRGKSIVSC